MSVVLLMPAQMGRCMIEPVRKNLSYSPTNFVIFLINYNIYFLKFDFF